VWSWHPDADAKFVMMLRITRVTVAKKPGAPRRARSKPLKPLRREGRLSGSYLWFLPRAFYSHGGHGCGQHPAFPAPSLTQEGGSFAKLGRAGATRPRRRARKRGFRKEDPHSPDLACVSRGRCRSRSAGLSPSQAPAFEAKRAGNAAPFWCAHAAFRLIAACKRCPLRESSS
jgi:hypothetical protein